MIVDLPTKENGKKQKTHARTCTPSLTKFGRFLDPVKVNHKNFRLPHQVDLLVPMSYCADMKRE